MHCSVSSSFSSYFGTDNQVSSVFSEPKVSIEFKVKREYVLAARTMIGGSETILAQNSFPLSHQTFNIDFPYVLLPTVNKNYIFGMLANMQIPPSNIERLSRQISSEAFVAACFCKELRFGFLHIVVEINVRSVEYYGSRSIDVDEHEAMMDIEVFRGFSIVPTSRSLIQASEIKKFDDDHTEEEEKESSTCAICMDDAVNSEALLGSCPCPFFCRFIKKRKEKDPSVEVVVATKFAALPWRFGRGNVSRPLRIPYAALVFLQWICTSFIDLPGVWGNEGYIDGLGDAVEQGLVKAVGVSNYNGAGFLVLKLNLLIKLVLAKHLVLRVAGLDGPATLDPI
ncbi:hypothetical protein NE237_033230 [Protea cynaroides]|uniref:Uncharacterized protein n=1 Tax=Protea cynaroides TaxID=273540 RepID=A0A9Q0R3U5_9MAGN|nr:hypothetical protein NE237_033230 [Protea cynaroides]